MRVRAIAGALVLAPTLMFAQAGRKDTTALPPVSVTATRSAASILTIPLAISKITAPELRATSGVGLDEALSKVPGVLAQSRYGTSDVRIVIRGFGARGAGDRSNAGTSRGIRVLIDGIPETEPDGRTAFDQIDLATANAVEVIRSNASSVWGNAAGGVVNVLTPNWSDRDGFAVQPVFGSFGLKRIAARRSMALGSTGTAWVNYTNTEYEGWRKHSDARRFLINAGAAGNLSEDVKVGFFASGVNNLIHIPGALTQAEMDADPTAANAQYASRDERRYNRVLRIGATLDHQINENASLSYMLFLNPKYLQRSERNTFRDFTRYHVGGNVIGRYEMGKSHFTAGVDEAYQDGAILFYSLVNGRRGPELRDNKSEGANNFGAFIQDEIQATDKLNLLVGARYDRISYYNKNFINAATDASKDYTQTTPKLGASWKLSATRSIYANFGGGVEVPAGNELDPYAAQGATSLNPLLEPIKSTTIEAGVKTVAERVGPLTLMGDVAVYMTSVKNDIQPYNEGRFYMSAGKTRRSGVELGLAGETEKGIFTSIALTASSNKYLEYSVDSSLFKAGAGTGVFDDNKVVGVPDLMANIELGTEIPGYRALRVKVGLEHVGKYFADDANAIEIPSYSLINFGLELRKPIKIAGDWGLKGFLNVHNVSDKQYVGSAFLNPIYVNGAPQVFEPGSPRAVTVSFSLGRE